MDSLVRLRSEVKAFWMPRWRRNALIGCTALAIGSYVTYRVHSSSFVSQKCRHIQSLLKTLSNIGDAADERSICSKLVCADLHAFLLSDKDDVPQSFRHLLKLGRSDDVRATIMTITAAFSHVILSTAMQFGGSLEGRKRRVSNGDSHSSNAGDVLIQCVEGVRHTMSHLRRIRQLHFVESQRDSGSANKRTQTGDRELKVLDELAFLRYILDESNGADDKGEQWDVSCERSRAKAVYGLESLDGRIPQRLLAKLVCPAGTGFASAVVGSAIRNLIICIIEYNQKTRIRGARRQPVSPLSPSYRFDTSPEATSYAEDGELDYKRSSVVRNVLDFACSSEGRRLISECFETFVATAVTAYLDKTKDVNMYEDFAARMTRHERQGPGKDVHSSVFSEVGQTLFRTSQEVSSVSSSGTSQTDQCPLDSGTEPLDDNILVETTSKLDRCKQTFPQDLSSPTRTAMFDQSKFWQPIAVNGRTPSEDLNLQIHEAEVRKEVHKQVHGTHGWVIGLSRMLAVPSNRKLVAEVAGTMSAEAIRSFCDAVMGVCCYLLRGHCGNFAENSDQQSTSLVRNSVGGRLEMFECVGRPARVATARYLLLMTLCLAIILHVMVSIDSDHGL